MVIGEGDKEKGIRELKGWGRMGCYKGKGCIGGDE